MEETHWLDESSYTQEGRESDQEGSKPSGEGDACDKQHHPDYLKAKRLWADYQAGRITADELTKLLGQDEVPQNIKEYWQK